MNLNALDLNLLRVFDALMRERSVTRAGERIGLSQPAVSAALNRLRHLVGDQLFVRRGNDMVPTPRAEDLSAPVRSALAEIEKAFAGGAGFDPATAQRTFTFMGADYFSVRLMPELARRISASAPGIILRLLDSARGDVDRLLQEDLIDAALERPLQVPEWISSELLFTSPFVVIAAAGNPKLAGIAPGEAIPLDLYCDLPQAIRSIDGSLNGFVDGALAGIGRRRRVVLALPHFHGIALSVAASGLIAAVPQQVADILPDTLGLAIYQVPIAMPEPDVRMYWHSRHDDDPGHRWIRAEIRAVLQPVTAASEA
ncbi:MAG TPA: LysR family transcriptional regulator [Dongiaceae bacterium]|nr:LysR family transcriptional regulator [Dongiaceae bacterium]